MKNLNVAASYETQVAAACLRERRIRRALEDYVGHHRSRVAKVAHEHERLADLALSFPALLFVIAVGHRGIDAAALRKAVAAGHPLKELAQMAGIPMWTRKLAPYAFDEPIGALPDEPLIAKLIVNHLPQQRKEAAIWLRCVSEAFRWCNGAFAVWVAKLTHKERLRLTRKGVQQLAVWAWHCQHPGPIAFETKATSWCMQMKLDAALDAANEWFDTASLAFMLASAIRTSRLRQERWEGRDFVHLATPAQIMDEARRMKNCIVTYAYSVSSRGDELWSVRRDGVSLATFLVDFHSDDELMQISEIKGFANSCVGPDVALAVRRWFMSHDIQSVSEPFKAPDMKPSRQLWQSFFKTYWRAKKGRPTWFKLNPAYFELDHVTTVTRIRHRHRHRCW